MESQNYGNHARYVKGYHFVLSTLLFIGILVSIYNYNRHGNGPGRINIVLTLLLFICVFMTWWFLRTFPLKAQDRAIRAEESLRYFILSGKAIDKRLTMSQIIALRFASDEEFLSLAEKAANENMTNKEIKQAITNWRADNHRA